MFTWVARIFGAVTFSTAVSALIAVVSVWISYLESGEKSLVWKLSLLMAVLSVIAVFLSIRDELLRQDELSGTLSTNRFDKLVKGLSGINPQNGDRKFIVIVAAPEVPRVQFQFGGMLHEAMYQGSVSDITSVITGEVGFHKGIIVYAAKKTANVDSLVAALNAAEIQHSLSFGATGSSAEAKAVEEAQLRLPNADIALISVGRLT